MGVFERAREFLYTQARLLDRRLFARSFEGGAGAEVLTALRAYQNEDGGFGHGLEPDLRGPGSQPIHVEIALHMAPSPDAPARAFFADDVIERHLDDLIARQQDDGGWPVLWNAPGPAAVAEWRGRWTLDALLTLRAYGRI